jgi:hypothetical protein
MMADFTEVEFLDINWRIIKKTILYSGLNKPDKKIRKTRKLVSIHEQNNECRNQTNSSLRRLPETSTVNASKNSISGNIL